jgi:uncharacterized membrane protein
VGIVISDAISILVRNATNGFLSNAIAGILTWVVPVSLELPLFRAALLDTRGQRPTTEVLRNFDRLGPFLVANLLVGIMVGIGFFLLVVPGIILFFFSYLTPFYVLDQEQSPVEAIRSSFRVIRNNIGPMALLALFGALLWVLGLVLCVVGLLVTGPVVLIAATYAYRMGERQPVAG